MERTGLDIDSNSLVESIHPYATYIPPRNASFGVMYNLFRPGNNFTLSLIDSDSSSSADPIRADCSLNDGIALELCSPREEIFQEVSSKRTSVHIPIEDDIEELQSYTENQSLIECASYNLQNFVPNVSEGRATKTSCCDIDLVTDNITSDNNGYASPLDIDDQVEKDHSCPYSETHIPQSDVESEPKQAESICKKSSTLTVPYNTMENSNNAIDNNLHLSSSNEHSLLCNIDANNHIFKLPNNELTFNGTLKHLQKLQPIVNAHLKEDYANDSNKDDMADYFPYKSSDEFTNSSPSGSVCSSKSGIFSSFSRFPSDFDAISVELPQKNNESDNIQASYSKQKDTSEKNFSFAGAVSPLKNKCDLNEGKPSANGLNRSSESYNSETRAQSPNLFSDDEDEYNEQKSENEILAATLLKFDDYDTRLIKILEKTFQGVLPPPSVTICQLSVNDILSKYKDNFERFDNSQSKDNDRYDPETSASMTPPRQINSDSMMEPSLSSSMAVAFENTLMPDQSVIPDGSNNEEVPGKPCNNVMYINGNEDIATNEDWPQITNYRFHGVHYNVGQHAETIDCLLSRYVSRYVGCETASSCTTIPLVVGTGYRGMVRRPHPSSAGAPSPSRRLSHLARRRAAFCTAASINVSVNRAKQILIDRKKFGSGSRTKRTPGKKTPGRKTPGKRTPAKKTPGKMTPSSSQKKAAARRLAMSNEVRVKPQLTRETSKRALFLSPDNIPKPVDVQQDLNKPSTSRIMKSKRALFGSPPQNNSNQSNVTKSDGKLGRTLHSHVTTSTYTDVNRKRSRDDSLDDVVPMTKLQKSLTFGGDKIGASTSDEAVRTLTRRSTEFISGRNELSELNKKKLLWAVAESLRPHGIGVTHEFFRLHAMSLVRLTRKLCTLPVHMKALRTPLLSTSETLFKIARSHAFAVIKGKSVDEIFQEEQIKQMNLSATKITGYMPHNYFEPSRASATSTMDRNSENSYGEVKVAKNETSASNKKTVLRDKTVNIDTTSTGAPTQVEIKKPTLFRDGESKLRARRQISFDNMEPSKR